MDRSLPPTKRAFDLVMATAMGLALLPVLLLVSLAVLVLEGRPVLYVSRRRTDAGAPKPVMKFRTMRRDADRVANRDTVPVCETRFLNLPITSALYTPVGRAIERLMLTEMPQLLHVLQGRMSIIGNRPLPQNVVASLVEEFPAAEDRFLAPCGLTGPVQLVGREFISDAERLEIEIAYCDAVLHAYSVRLDAKILAFTVLGGFIDRYRFTPAGVLGLIAAHGGTAAAQAMAMRHRAPALAAREPRLREPLHEEAAHGVGGRAAGP
jgi:lipopolysaccharide/colanic/teichoic acid biosynthesis glycosyltransferase